MTPVAFIAHHLPGRARLRIPSMRGHRSYFEGATRRLLRSGQVIAVRSTPECGSMVVEYACTFAELDLIARKHDLFTIHQPAPARASNILPVDRSAQPARVLPRRGLRTVTTDRCHSAGVSIARLARLGRRGPFGDSGLETLGNACRVYAERSNPLVAMAVAGFGIYQLASSGVLPSMLNLAFNALEAALVESA